LVTYAQKQPLIGGSELGCYNIWNPKMILGYCEDTVRLKWYMRTQFKSELRGLQ